MDSHFDDVSYTDIAVQRKHRATPVNVTKSRGRLYRLLIIVALMITSIVLVISIFSVSSTITDYQKQYEDIALLIEKMTVDRKGISQTAEALKKSNKQLQTEISKIENDAKSVENKVSELKKDNEELEEKLSKLQRESDDMNKKIDRLKIQTQYYSQEMEKMINNKKKELIYQS